MMIPVAQKRMQIAPGLNFDPQAIVGTRWAIVGKSGAGKSWTLRTLCEEHLLGKIPLIILDPEGEFSVFADHFPMIVAGNEGRAQVALNEFNAPSLAALVFEQKISIVLDLGTVKHHEQDRVAAAFLDAFWDRAIAAFSRGEQTVCTIVVDEAQEFIPQKSNKESSGVLIDIAKRGRKRGVGMIIASQRPASIDKDVLTQSSCIIAHQMVGIDLEKMAVDPIPVSRSELGRIMRPFKPGEAVLTGSLIDGGEAGYIVTRIRPSIMAGEAPEMQLPSELRPLSAEVIGALQTGLSHLEAEHAEEDKERVAEHDQLRRQLAQAGDENKKLVKDVDILRKEVARLEKALAAKPTEVIVEVPAPNGKAKTTVPEMDDDDLRTPLALTRAVNRQERLFSQLIGQIARQTIPAQRVFGYLLQYDEYEFSVRELSRNIGYSMTTLESRTPKWLVDHGYVRKDRGGKYQSTTRKKLAQEFPDLDTEALVVRLLKRFDPERKLA